MHVKMSELKDIKKFKRFLDTVEEVSSYDIYNDMGSVYDWIEEFKLDVTSFGLIQHGGSILREIAGETSIQVPPTIESIVISKYEGTLNIGVQNNTSKKVSITAFNNNTDYQNMMIIKSDCNLDVEFKGSSCIADIHTLNDSDSIILMPHGDLMTRCTGNIFECGYYVLKLASDETIKACNDIIELLKKAFEIRFEDSGASLSWLFNIKTGYALKLKVELDRLTIFDNRLNGKKLVVDKSIYDASEWKEMMKQNRSKMFYRPLINDFDTDF